MTATPGLPPLLTNESYQCQFADRERQRVITVGAEEVTPNTAYQCNITGRIPTFTGVQLGKMYYVAVLMNCCNISDCKTFHKYHLTVDGFICTLYMNNQSQSVVAQCPMFGQH